jgi:hypothetical protein
VDDVDDEDACPLPESELLDCCAIAGKPSHPLKATSITERSASSRTATGALAAGFSTSRSITF